MLHFGDGAWSYWEVESVLGFQTEEDKRQRSWGSVKAKRQRRRKQTGLCWGPRQPQRRLQWGSNERDNSSSEGVGVGGCGCTVAPTSFTLPLAHGPRNTCDCLFYTYFLLSVVSLVLSSADTSAFATLNLLALKGTDPDHCTIGTSFFLLLIQRRTQFRK